ncbi:helix-turn-helix transcriptional regulator [Leptothoe spongobia]|uniref:Helix-turn-helix transcriptional regulator n=1 Tax=Leptothoe spongobia TAU-MAC 1115 TaxID=1967444 RepID=A0A947DCU5_9CYAN|nr:helix-turn-helix transcriptional regulator [Leptothoe spongobia]MBT9314707.1 helix-turn-helix transcriptional regulator [Leptothoe spongobia TAU-MAC 1115]
MTKEVTSATGASSRTKIAELREALGMTQQELAVFVGVSNNTIQNWEAGKSGVDQIKKFLRLCAILDCELSDLIDDSEVNESKGFSLTQLRALRKQWLEADDDPA